MLYSAIMFIIMNIKAPFAGDARQDSTGTSSGTIGGNEALIGKRQRHDRLFALIPGCEGVGCRKQIVRFLKIGSGLCKNYTIGGLTGVSISLGTMKINGRREGC